MDNSGSSATILRHTILPAYNHNGSLCSVGQEQDFSKILQITGNFYYNTSSLQFATLSPGVAALPSQVSWTPQSPNVTTCAHGPESARMLSRW